MFIYLFIYLLLVSVPEILFSMQTPTGRNNKQKASLSHITVLLLENCITYSRGWAFQWGTKGNKQKQIYLYLFCGDKKKPNSKVTISNRNKNKHFSSIDYHTSGQKSGAGTQLFILSYLNALIIKTITSSSVKNSSNL